VTKPAIVYIIDDDDDLRESIAAALKGAGYFCETYASAMEFLAILPCDEPCCAVVDIRMPIMDGLALMAELRRRNLSIPVVVMTAFGEVELAVRAMKAGAIDFIEKPFRFSTLKDAVDGALEKARQSSNRVARQRDAERLMSRLTKRERDVFELLAIGEGNKAIALRLGISARTVEIYRARVMQKLEAKNLPDLVRLSLMVGTSQNADGAAADGANNNS
jgi:two-component system response regulator FixJ